MTQKLGITSKGHITSEGMQEEGAAVLAAVALAADAGLVERSVVGAAVLEHFLFSAMLRRIPDTLKKLYEDLQQFFQPGGTFDQEERKNQAKHDRECTVPDCILNVVFGYSAEVQGLVARPLKSGVKEEMALMLRALGLAPGKESTDDIVTDIESIAARMVMDLTAEDGMDRERITQARVLVESLHDLVRVLPATGPFYARITGAVGRALDALAAKEREMGL